MKASLVNALRKGTDVLLKIDSYEITLIPHARVKKPGGVYDWEPQPARPPQKFQVEPVGATLSGISGASGGVSAADGAQAHTWSYNLRGRYDAQVAIGDVWKAGETSYRVVSIQPYNDYEKVAVVSAIGKDPHYGS